MAKRYQPQALIAEQGGVQTFSGRDALNGLPVRMYTFMGEPTAKVGELSSPYLPPVLSSSFVGGAGEVITAFADEFKPLKGAVTPGQVEILLRQSAAALDDAARAGIVHGDLSPERVLFDREAGTGGRFLLEGYGVPWRVRPSEFSAPERISGPSFAADLFSWARTVTHLSGPLPGDLRDLLAPCLDADPAVRPQAREVRAALDGYSFGARAPKPVSAQAARDVSAFDGFGGNDEDADDFADPVLIDSPVTDAPVVSASSSDPGAADPLPAVKVFTAPTTTPRLEDSSERDTQGSARVQRIQDAPPSQPTPPQASGTIWTLPREAEDPGASLPADSLRLTDQTSAYRARRAQYDAERARSAPPDDAPPKPASPESTPARPGVRVRPLTRPQDDSSSSHEHSRPPRNENFEDQDDFEVSRRHRRPRARSDAEPGRTAGAAADAAGDRRTRATRATVCVSLSA